LPSLEDLHQEFKDKPFALVAINLKESRDAVLNQVRSAGLSYTNLIDKDGKISAIYGVSSTPMKFVIDAKGNMVAAALGYREWDRDEIRSLINILMIKNP
jgi:cytochrome c biogenesis protein CcmG/thiol:disulfide interchange protein DsbE